VPVRILLDQNAPLGLRLALTEHEVIAARSMGWATTENGALIRAAETAGFAILINCDRNIRHQQNRAGRQIALIELTTSVWPVIRDRLPDVLAAIAAATPGSYTTVSFPRSPLRRPTIPAALTRIHIGNDPQCTSASTSPTPASAPPPR
jgi:hypothetical protein